ncbi:MAG TPA: pyridoxamine 5'-phosphate oxidase family protein [Candidatus Binataceae bacterium]
MKKIGTLYSMLAIAATLLATLIAAPAGCAGFSERDVKAFDANTLVYVATVRKDGNQSKAAPVWFTLSDARDQLLIQTHKDTWKAKRIRRGSPVMVWIGSSTGPAFLGKAEITTDATVENKILTDFPKRYTTNFLMGPSQKTFDSGDRVAIRITPAKDLPDGFESQPGTPAPPLDAK